MGESYDSGLIKCLPYEKNPLREVNRLCCLPGLFLDGYTEFDRSSFGGWLDPSP